MGPAILILLLLFAVGGKGGGGKSGKGGSGFGPSEAHGRNNGYPWQVEHMAGGGYAAVIVTDPSGTEHTKLEYGETGSTDSQVFEAAVKYAEDWTAAAPPATGIPWPKHFNQEGVGAPGSVDLNPQG